MGLRIWSPRSSSWLEIIWTGTLSQDIYCTTHLCFWFQPPVHLYPEKQQVWAQAAGSLPPTWEAWVEFQVPDFKLASYGCWSEPIKYIKLINFKNMATGMTWNTAHPCLLHRFNSKVPQCSKPMTLDITFPIANSPGSDVHCSSQEVHHSSEQPDWHSCELVWGANPHTDEFTPFSFEQWLRFL